MSGAAAQVLPSLASTARRTRTALLAPLLALAFGCSSDGSKPLPPLSPDQLAARHFASSGSPLLAMAPGGAQLVVEIDVRRLRDNPVLGDLVRAASTFLPDTGLGFDVARDADVVVICAYAVGTAQAETVTFVASERLAALAGSEVLTRGVVVVGSKAMRERAEAVRDGKVPALDRDSRFMKVRDAAVPEGAPGAALRITGVLDFDGRIGMARMFALDHVPTAISVWADVADDLAVVGLLGAESPKDSKELAEASRAKLAQVAAQPLVERLVLSYLLRQVKVTAGKAAARLLLVIPPHRLDLLTRRLLRYAEDFKARSPVTSAEEKPES